jgi:hypothetical protein
LISALFTVNSPDVGQNPPLGVWRGIRVAIVNVPGKQVLASGFGDQFMPILPLIHSSSLKSAFVRTLSSSCESDKAKVKELPPLLIPNARDPFSVCSSVVTVPLDVVVVDDQTSLILLKPTVASITVESKLDVSWIDPLMLFVPLVTPPETAKDLLNVPVNTSVEYTVLLM